MNRAMVVITGNCGRRHQGVSVAGRTLQYSDAFLHAGDLIADGWHRDRVQIVRLPRRLFRRSVAAQHNTWMLTSGASLGQVL